MSKLNPTIKRAQIDKANVQIVFAISVTVFIFIFSLVSVKALWSRQSYQNKVIESREKARDQLKANIEAANKLTESYKQFVTDTPNKIGGNPVGQGERDGDNAKIILDALPSAYDYPALTSSLEKLAKNEGLEIKSIEGTDDSINQSNNGSAAPVLVEMPFKVTVSGAYQNTGSLISQFEKSIRPFKIGKLVFKGDQNGLVELAIEGKSYYQPAKNLEIKKEIVQ